MNLQIYYLIIGIVSAILLLYLYRSKNEGFETTQRVILKTVDGKYAKVCKDKHLCLTDIESERDEFSILKFDDDLISLSNGGYYISSCFEDSCKDNMILVNNFNPYAPNCKLSLEKVNDYYYVRLYDNTYFSIDDSDHFIKTQDKSRAIRLQLI